MHSHQQVGNAIELAFTKLAEGGRVRQTLLGFRQNFVAAALD